MHYPHDRLSQCTATCPFVKRSPEECRFFQMHPRAFHVLALTLTAVVRAGCDDKTKWYSGLRSIIKNCPSLSQNSSDQDELLDIFRKCVQQRAIDTLDTLLDDDVITIYDGVDLIRLRPNDENNTEYKDNFDGSEEEDISWSAIIWNRMTRVLRTHAFKIDVDHIFNTAAKASARNSDNNVVQGRKRQRRRNYMFPLMMMGLLLMGSILVPMGFQFLAVLGGKALILAKMALILSSIQGLKKIATSGVNYGLYHHVPDAWHDRSHQVFEEEHYPVYSGIPPRP
ncbi:uncharacterized protein LOC112455457 [Temnothorax curvispinosus]|uniref:Uncharacterized protein LOC112455457 n=1 Tax=Temnothorax curvispinosus TaxID=300111 RepID=A0A6J1PWE7_9HYME|nr:uncharacterized protein LOC112455457 [Temnothorax curvispinosus]